MATGGVAASFADTTAASNYTTGSFSPSVGDWLFLAVANTGSVVLGTVVDSLAENTWSNVTDLNWPDNTGRFQFWKATAATTTANSRTVSYQCTGDASTGCEGAVIQVTGSTGIVRQSAFSRNVASSTPAIALTSAVSTDSWMLSVLANLSNGAGVTEPSGWILNRNSGFNNPTTGQDTASKANGFTASNVTWGSTSATSWYAHVFEIASTTVAAVPDPGYYQRLQGNYHYL